MRKIFVLFAVSLLSSVAFAQQNMQKMLLIKELPVQALYATCGNEIKVSIVGKNVNEKIKYSAENAVILPSSKVAHLIIMPNNGTKNVVLKAFSGDKLIASETLSVREVPGAEVVITGFEDLPDSEYSKLIKVPTEISLKVIPDEEFALYFPKDISYRVNSFSITQARGSKPVAKWKSEGNRVDLSGIVVEDGDRLVVINIVAQRTSFRGELLDAKLRTKFLILNIKQ